MKRDHLRVVEPRQPTIIPCPPQHRDEATRALCKGLQELNAKLTGLRMGVAEVGYPWIDSELASISERLDRLRSLLEVPDAG